MKKINIEEIKSIKQPVYVLIAGAIGAGKSFVVSKYLNGIEVIDPDEITKVLGNGEYISTNVAQSMAITKETVTTKLKDGKSFIQQGTSANLQSSINKMKQAKANGFTTVMLFVDTPISQAVVNVSNRSDRNIISPRKIERTANGAKHTFDFMSEQPVTEGANIILENMNITVEAAQALTDYTVHYKNIQ